MRKEICEKLCQDNSTPKNERFCVCWYKGNKINNKVCSWAVEVEEFIKENMLLNKRETKMNELELLKYRINYLCKSATDMVAKTATEAYMLQALQTIEKICQYSDSDLNAVLADGWRETSKILPEVGVVVLTYDHYGMTADEREVMIGFIDMDDGHWYIPWTEEEIKPTHWQPLPLPPTVR